MTVLKAGPKSSFYYLRLLINAGVPGIEIGAIWHPRKARGLNPTNKLLVMRKMFADAGYADEVAEVDQEFIDTYRGYGSQKAWNAYWKDYCANTNGLGGSIPESAL